MLDCLDQLYTPAMHRFKEKNPQGIELKRADSYYSKSRYRPYNSNLSFGLVKTSNDTEEWKIKFFTTKTDDFYSMLHQSKEEMVEYVKYMKLKDASPSDILPTLLMPKVMHSEKAYEILKTFKDWVLTKHTKGQGPFLVDLKDILKFADVKPPKRINRKEKIHLGLLIPQNGIGMIPSLDFDQMLTEYRGKIGIFYHKDFDNWRPSTLYKFIEYAISICISIAKAKNNQITEFHWNFMINLIDQNIYLSSVEKASLHTVLLWQSSLEKQRNLVGISTHEIDYILKVALGSLLVEIATIDGDRLPKRNSVVKRIFNALEIDQLVYLNHYNSDSPEPSLWRKIFSSEFEKEGIAYHDLTFAKWIRPNEKVTIEGGEINGGFFYYGDILIGQNKTKQDVSVISEKNIHRDDSYRYWYYYDRIKGFYELYDSQRKEYLQWIASSRNDITTKLFVLEAYFIGIERRVIIDSKIELVDNTEYLENYHEVQRLQRVFGEEYPEFNQKLCDLLGLMVVMRSDLFADSHQSEIFFQGIYGVIYKMALHTKNNKPIKGPLMCGYLYSKFNNPYYDAVELDPVHFLKYISHHFDKEFPEGIKLNSTEASLKFRYQPLNPSLVACYLTPPTDLNLPNFNELPYHDLSRIFDDASYYFDHSINYLERDATSNKDLAYLSIIPKVSLKSKELERLNHLKHWLDDALLNQHGLIEIDELLPKIVADPSQIDSQDCECIINTFTHFSGYAYAPNSTYHNTNFRSVNTLALVKYDNVETRIKLGKVYQRMLLQLRMLAIILNASGNKNIISKQEKLSQFITQESRLNKNQKANLKAYANWRLNGRGITTGLDKLSKKLGKKQKKRMCETLISFGVVNHLYDKKTQQKLEKMYELLGENSKEVVGHIHQYINNTSKTSKKKSKIDFESGSIKLQKNLIKKQKTATAKSQKILSDIFDDEESKDFISSENANKDIYYQLFLELIKKEKWNQSEVSALCQKHHLMTKAALEVINDKSLDLVDEPLFEEEESFMILNAEIIPHLKNHWNKET